MKAFWGLLIIALGCSGCGKNYMAEREFYKARQILQQADASAGLEALDPVASAFQRVVDKYPGTPKAMESLELISNIRLRQKKYDEARKAMTAIIENFASSRDKVADARFRIAQIYEVEGNWNAAEKTYWDLAQLSPLHVKGLYAPVRILLNYKNKGDERGLERQYVRTLDHFQGLIKQVGRIEAVAPVKNYLAMAYVVKGEPQKAVQEWISIYEQFPANPYAPMALLAAAETSWRQNQIKEAEELYGTYYDAYPFHALAGKTAVTLGLMYQGKKDFETARLWYQKAMNEYFKEKSTERAEIKLLLAKTYQDEVLWEEAEGLYKELVSEYQHTSAALQVPLLRAQYFSSIGDEATSKAILDDAIESYESLTEAGEAGTGTDVARFAQRFKSAALAQKGAWTELLAEVDRYYDEETQPERKGRWLFLKALLTQNRLQAGEQAALLYRRFIAEYPEHSLVPRAQRQLQTLQQA